MITFEDHGSQVVLIYTSGPFNPAEWLDEKLKVDGAARLS